MYLVTGVAGFIGFHLSLELLNKDKIVIGVDNINNYYDQKIKYDRLKILSKYKNFTFSKVDIADRKSVSDVFIKFKPNKVVNLGDEIDVMIFSLCAGEDMPRGSLYFISQNSHLFNQLVKK